MGHPPESHLPASGARNILGWEMTIKIVSWNIAKRNKPWRELLDMGVDVALLQEEGNVPPWVQDEAGVGIGPREHWDSHS